MPVSGEHEFAKWNRSKVCATSSAFRRERLMSIAAYVRVSSRSQNNATQREAIERAAKARGDEIETWFEEKRTAKPLDRPKLAELRALARAGEVQRLYVFRLDRLARSGIRDTLAVLDEFKIVGCRVVTIADGFDLEGPASDIVVAVLGWAAQMERLALGERIAAARIRVESKGGKWGRPRRTTPDQAQEILTRKKKGHSVRRIAIALKVPRSTVADVVSGKSRGTVQLRFRADVVSGKGTHKPRPARARAAAPKKR